jgi:hypothetical protein
MYSLCNTSIVNQASKTDIYVEIIGQTESGSDGETARHRHPALTVPWLIDDGFTRLSKRQRGGAAAEMALVLPFSTVLRSAWARGVPVLLLSASGCQGGAGRCALCQPASFEEINCDAGTIPTLVRTDIPGNDADRPGFQWNRASRAMGYYDGDGR